jgi:ABC-2 type transport system permease protein
MNPGRTFYWSIRRELWENRSIWVAPLLLAGLALLGFLVGSHALLERWRGLVMLGDASLPIRALRPFGLAASVVLVTGWIVGVFYAADALHGERRDRSILFWKSMPVSDCATVLSKAAIPLVVQPLVALVVAVALQALMLVFGSAVLLANGLPAAPLWTLVPWLQVTLVMCYGVTAHVLWFAPIYAWLLLVSAWARRAPLLWAILPFFAAAAVEAIAFGTRHVVSLLKYRITGAMGLAFGPDATREAIAALADLEPLRFLAAPGLWGGIVFAAVCLAAAIRVRRHREPL